MWRFRLHHAALVVGIAALCPLNGVADGERARWTVDGQTYSLYKANLHTHTRWSANKVANNFRLSWNWDHHLGRPPDETLRDARAVGLDIVGFSDHAFQLDPWEWGLRKWKDFPYGTILGNTGVQTVPCDGGRNEFILGLAGFEWTPGGDVGHINVFFPGRIDPGTSVNTDETIVLYARSEKHGADRFDGIGAELCPSLDDFYQALADLGEESGQYAPIAQFNHVGAMRPSLSDLNVDTYPGHFADFRFREDLRECMVLLEVSTKATDALDLEVASIGRFNDVVNCEIRRGELLFREALRKGWHVAPSSGMDNSTADLSPMRRSYTGIWAERLSSEAVWRALQKRRVYATEMGDLSLGLYLIRDDGTVPMGSELTGVPAGSLRFELVANSPTLGTEDLDVELVQVCQKGCRHFQMSRRSPLLFEGLAPVDEETICCYVRVERDDEMALTAPIWVDIEHSPEPDQPTPLRIAFVMDRSGSMGWEGKLARAQEAAQTLVRRLPQGSSAGLNWFSRSGQVGHELTELSTSRREAELMAAIDSLEAGDATNMWDGIRFGLNMLRGAATEATSRCLLMSDGCNNTGHSDANVVDLARDSAYPIDTVAYGSDADRQLLADVAMLSGGAAMPADTGTVLATYDRLGVMARGYSVTAAYSQLMQRGNRISFPFTVPGSASAARVSVDWAGGDWPAAACELGVKLRNPSGETLGLDDLAATLDRSPCSLAGEFSDPEAGEWEVELAGKELPGGDETQMVNVSVACDLPFQVNVTDLLPEMPAGQEGASAARRATVVIEPGETDFRPADFSLAAAVMGPEKFARQIDLSEIGSHMSRQYLAANLSEAAALGPYVFSVAVTPPDHHEESVLLQYGLQVGKPRHNPLSPDALLNQLEHGLRKALWQMIISGEAPDEILGEIVTDITRGKLGATGVPRDFDLEQMRREAEDVLRR